eukprot:CAMPEP_0114400394 /NCGR_PEP_ID=MMETSP0102-20121206/16371_1 /TAXON_ID=38822 ORGANISM="Pteridomonas danica, Strain PT" /NCGR_SAMPLE_ID=MMETSP0102 /ASSEMBLY_ACC=CAM_ASM_000212 /LENGTH=562 /DNA_ID=CAMNT_0001562763 /DNA_START=123 /DNA_END=1811 /DNA_ORIENTATION=-
MKIINNDDIIDDIEDADSDSSDDEVYRASGYTSFIFDDDALQLDEQIVNNEYDFTDDFDKPKQRSSTMSFVKQIVEEKIMNMKRKRVMNHYGSTLLYRIMEFIALFSFLIFSSIGPNILLVIIVIGNYSSDVKIFITLSVAFFKASLTALIIPTASERIATCLFPTSSWGYRFRAAVNIAVIISSCSLVLGPILIVSITDPRCLYYHFKPQNKVTADVTFQFCTVLDQFGVCSHYEEETMPSSYIPQFEYDGNECVSAVISTYAPVFLTHVLLSTPISAVIELILVPLIAPWCFQNRYVNKWVGRVLFGLRAATYNTPCLLSITNPESLNEITKDVDLDRSARNIMRRAYVQFASSILLVATFGLAAPVVGVASILAALIHFKHQTFILSQLLTFEELIQNESFGVLNFKHCCTFPNFSSFIMIGVIILFWIFMTIDNFVESYVLYSTLFVWGILIIMLMLFALKCSRDKQLNKELHQPLTTPDIDDNDDEEEDNNNNSNNDDDNNDDVFDDDDNDDDNADDDKDDDNDNNNNDDDNADDNADDDKNDNNNDDEDRTIPLMN